MARVKYNSKDVTTLGRLIKSEALGEGNTGMLLVANTGVNRIVYKCMPFKNITSVNKMVYQKGNFEGVNTKLFNAPVNSKIKGLAKKGLNYWRGKPAVNALYFQNPGKSKNCKNRFWGKLSGRYKNHCFYNPDKLIGCGL
ncbi:MAG: cell wall hydrolase [Bacilli bacterium]|nr:cell wall hydrolase [Bacilli bacterium]